MSLKINGRNIQSLPLRFRGAVGFEYAETNKGSQRNLYASEGITDDASGNPAGHLYPSAWIWPQKPGSITAFRTTFGTSTALATLAAGIGILGTSAGVATVSATPQAVGVLVGSTSGSATASATASTLALMSGTSAGSSTVSGTAIIISIISISGTSSATSSATATIGALVFMTGTANGVATATALPTARAYLEGEVSPFTPLSPQSLALAVWSAEASQNNEPGTMGELLNGAGGGATPSVIADAVWDALLSSHTDPGSMGEAVTLLQTELAKKLTKVQFLALK